MSKLSQTGQTASAAAKSIAVHAVFGAVLVFGLSHSDAREIRRPEIINATIVDISQLNADRQQEQAQREARQRQQQAREQQAREEQVRQEQRKQQEQQAQREAERQREQQRLAKLNEEQLERARQQREDQERADELRRKREEIAAERRRLQQQAEQQAADEATARAEEDADLMRQMLAQEEQGRAQASKRQQWEARVRQLVQQNWRKTPMTPDDMVCVLNIRMVPGGDVTDVSLADCRIDASTERSIKDAVMRSSPLPWEGFEDVALRAFGFRFCAQETACERN